MLEEGRHRLAILICELTGIVFNHRFHLTANVCAIGFQADKQEQCQVFL